eukprot:7390244-Prymnesium_polylepis.1
MAALARDPLALIPPLTKILDVLALHIVRARIGLVACLEHAVHNKDPLLADLDLLCRPLASWQRLDRLDVGSEADDRRAVVVALASCTRLRIEPVGLELGAIVGPYGGGRLWLESLVHLPNTMVTYRIGRLGGRAAGRLGGWAVSPSVHGAASLSDSDAALLRRSHHAGRRGTLGVCRARAPAPAHMSLAHLGRCRAPAAPAAL